MPRLALLTVVAVSFFLSGCSPFALLYREKFVEPDYDLRDERVVVVPFKDLRKWYFEVAEGRDLATGISARLSTEGGVEPVGGKKIHEAVWDNVDEVDWTAVGELVDADYVLYGTIREFHNDARGVVGIVRGRLTLDLLVWNVEEDRLAFQAPIEIIYPEDIESGEIMVSMEQSDRELRIKLFAKAIKKIGALFCGEWVDNYCAVPERPSKRGPPSHREGGPLRLTSGSASVRASSTKTRSRPTSACRPIGESRTRYHLRRLGHLA